MTRHNMSGQHCAHTDLKSTQQGFTLLELLVVMLLMGIMLAISVGSMFQQENSIRAEAHKIVRIAMEARSRAILLNDSVRIELRRESIRILHKDTILYNTRLEGDVELDALNEKVIDRKAHSIVVHHLGIINESVIWLQQGSRQTTIYLPAIGAPKIYDDYISLEVIHKELL